jgi:hypothetical protein
MNNKEEDADANPSKTTHKPIVPSRTQIEKLWEIEWIIIQRILIDLCHEHIHVMGIVKRTNCAVAYKVPLK